MPELSTERTATRITACRAMPAPGMPTVSSAATKGDLPATSVFHGRMITIRSVELTKKNRMRKTTLFTARRMLRPGSADSAAAIVTTSTPVMAKMTTTMPLKSALTPLGKKPPYSVRLEGRCRVGPEVKDVDGGHQDEDPRWPRS